MQKDNLFFEGEDFPGRPFKALMPKFYPPEYQEYIRQETVLIEEKLRGKGKILEAGVGIGRLIPIIAPLVKEVIGIDKAGLMVEQSQEVSKAFNNVTIVKFELEKLTSVFPAGSFDATICAWNTLGNVEDEACVLRQFKQVTNGPVLISVFLKGILEQRKNWYKTVGIELDDVDEASETVYTTTGLKSKAYSLDELSKFAEEAGLFIKDSKVLNNLVLWAELGNKT